MSLFKNQEFFSIHRHLLLPEDKKDLYYYVSKSKK